MQSSCPICNSSEITNLFEPISESPLARYGLSSDLNTALNCPTYEVFIKTCLQCSHLFNCMFGAQDVDYTSENVAESRTFSPRYFNYLMNQAARLSELLSGSSNTILEVGSGSGDFLHMFRKFQHKIGFEPGPEALQARQNFPEIDTRNTFFSIDPESHNNLAPNLIVMRQVLEHVPNPIDFLKCFHALLTRSRDGDRLLYVEVPATNVTLSKSRFSDFYYDHVGFFTMNSLSEAMRQSGFFIETLEPVFDGEIISCIARPVSHVLAHSDLNESQRHWSKLIDTFAKEQKRVLFWGSAGTGTMFLNMLKIDRNIFPYVIDSDPRKHGKFIPGTGQEVVSPSFITNFRPDVVFIMSQLHSIEIAETIDKLLSYKPELYIL